MGLMSALSSWRLRPGASAWPEANGFLFFADGLAGLLIGACLLMTALGLSLQAIQWHQQARQRQLAAMPAGYGSLGRRLSAAQSRRLGGPVL